MSFSLDSDDIKRQAANERHADLERDAWNWLMASPHGRRIARTLIGLTGTFSGGFSADALTSSYREGQRDVGMYVLDAVRLHAPDQFPNLFKDEA